MASVYVKLSRMYLCTICMDESMFACMNRWITVAGQLISVPVNTPVSDRVSDEVEIDKAEPVKKFDFVASFFRSRKL